MSIHKVMGIALATVGMALAPALRADMLYFMVDNAQYTSDSGKSGSAKKVSPVKDYLEGEEWVEELNGKDLKAFLKNLKKTDIPSEYLEELEDYIDRYF